MAEPILLNLPPSDPRETLYKRLESAPHEHAEALLTTYDILQGLHDQGILELAKGALGSSEKVLQIVVDAANTPEVIRGIRNVMILAKIADAIDPHLLESLAKAVPEGLAEAQNPRPLGYWQLMKKLLSRDTRRVLLAGACVLWNRWEKALVLKDLTTASHFVPVPPRLCLIFHTARRLVFDTRLDGLGAFSAV
jgi:uncharacterized protein YjgD (DUF1641 family)